MPEPIDPMLQFLLGGKKPRFRREPYQKSKTWTEMSDADDALDGEDYAQLLAMQHDFRTVEEAIIEAFHWATVDGISYDDAAAWFAQGALYRDRGLMRRMVAAGLTPAITRSRYVVRPGAEPVTVLVALQRRLTTPERIAEQARAKGRNAR